MFGKKEKEKSMLVRVLDTPERPIAPLFVLCVLAAVLCDIIRALGHVLVCLLLVVIISAGVMGGIVWFRVKPLYNEYMTKAEEAVKDTTVDTFRYNETSVIYDKTGKVMSTLSEDRNTEYLSYEDIPMDVVNAFIAIEDRTYWTNPGIDWKGIGRVVLNAVVSKGDDIAGASTITQQLSRAVFLSNNVSIDRKLTEMAISIKLTEKFSKEQIMEFYVNNCYFANGYYGIESAAIGYFGKQAKDLTLGEVAYLCAIPNSPTYYDPRVNPDRALERRDLILEAMYDVGYISKADMEDAKAETFTILATDTEIGGYDTTYAVDCAVREFMKLDGFEFKYHFDTDDDYKTYTASYDKEYARMRTELLRGGYSVYTSIDPDLQNSLQEITDKYVEEKRKTTGHEDLQASVVVMNKEGLVSAIIGGAGQGGYGFNRGYQAYRQPGSTIKPLVVYTPAIESGYMATSAVKNISVSDVQTAMRRAQASGTIYDISKAEGQSVTLRYALEQSLNGVAYSLMNELTPKKTVTYLEKMHFAQILPEDYTLSASLGGLTNGATPIEMAGGYACIANGGIFNEPTCITSIIDRYGKERYEMENGERVYSERGANLMTDLMSGVPKTGTAASIKWYDSSDTTLYCKTGTTDSKKDNWLCGFAGDNVMAVWIGCDTPKNLGTFGATGAGSLFKESMLKALELNPIEEKEVQEEDEKVIDEETIKQQEDLLQNAADEYKNESEEEDAFLEEYYGEDYSESDGAAGSGDVGEMAGESFEEFSGDAG